ncbi:hypothetical protein UFOVP116_27 [uncultured Caudovirales phage]|uniref:Uncharacterized protein n=1 Tax=uncultured Caudovirales phage TaxID=2100421 RepID=A0A6J5L9K0_9CAUD|nr:hypothetical protein UFOVP116_27 [uncultured Caudovirales phage]
MKIIEIIPSSLNEAYYSDYDRREQRSMDQFKRDFKRDEMEHELRHEDDALRQQKYKSSMQSSSAPSIYYITINGKIWRKDGSPVQFNGISHANAVANKIKARDTSKDVRVTATAAESGISAGLELIDEDSHYDAAEEILANAKEAKQRGDIGEFYTLMADYHDRLVQWHESKGRHIAADREAAKVEKYHAAAQAHVAKSDFE